MQQLQLVSSALAMAALVVCGWVFTRKPRKKLPTETVSLSKKKGALIGRAAGGPYRLLKKLNQVCDGLDFCNMARCSFVAHFYSPGDGEVAGSSPASVTGTAVFKLQHQPQRYRSIDPRRLEAATP